MRAVYYPGFGITMIQVEHLREHKLVNFGCESTVVCGWGGAKIFRYQRKADLKVGLYYQ